MNDPHIVLLALVAGLISVIALTVWWPNPAERRRPRPDPADPNLRAPDADHTVV
ncbi:hypothetical protein ACFVVM_22970 [Nocardia sp. NPDC058176]|uniref:hypothetical protein n=1 Tax=Nocardia sp. NPDC058176 TaxID=3346368 RepID=UPI0036DCE6FA